MRIRFSGYSDDCLEYDRDNGGADEINPYRRPGWYKVTDSATGEGLMVFGQYAPTGSPDGTWVLGVTMLAEGVPLPKDWPISYETHSNGYSPVLVIEAPPTAIITAGPEG